MYSCGDYIRLNKAMANVDNLMVYNILEKQKYERE